MRKFFIIVVLVVVGVKYGAAYLLSENFQTYADRTKAPWTCEFENDMGHMNMVFSDYITAQVYFGHVVKRCPDSSYMEEAMFETARCIENVGENRRASVLYNEFAEKYPGTKRARIALRAADLIRPN